MPLTVLGGAVALSSWASPLPRQATAPRAAMLAAAVAVGVVASRRRRGPGATELWFLGGGLVLAGLQAGEPNEMAGILTLVVPFAVVRVLFPDRRLFLPGFRRRWTNLALAMVSTGLLIHSGSRGGLLWSAVAVAIVLGLTGRRGRRLLGWAVSALLAVAILVGPERLAGFWLYGGDLSLPAGKLLTGRPEIWQRTLRALADAPVTGFGLGVFDPVIRTVYPPAQVAGTLDDAHNLFLDTAFSLGLPGLLALLGLLAAAFHRLGSPVSRRPAAGAPALLASLLGHVLYSLTDAVALGTPGSLVFGYLLGTIRALPVRPPYRPRRRSRRGLAAILAALLLLVCLLLPVVRMDVASVRAVGAILGGGTLAGPRIELVHLETCRSWWLVGLLDQAAGDLEGRDASWNVYLECSGGVPSLLPAAVPGHRGLSRRALVLHPDDAAAYFWHAATWPRTDPAVVDLYRRGLLLEPSNGLAWIALGDGLAGPAVADPVAAFGAYVEGCRRGDPGLNGCWRAGRTAEALGDFEAAIRIYRRSRWERAKKRADDLEQGPGPAPGPK